MKPAPKKKLDLKMLDIRANKLKSKKTQLENLLRSRERLDFEIKKLKKSIARDRKMVTEATNFLKEAGEENRELSEVLENADPETSENELKCVLWDKLQSVDKTYDDILDLLLHFGEDS